MKVKQQIISALLTIALFISLTSPLTAAAAQNVTLSMELSADTVAVGEMVTLTVRTEQAFFTCGAGMTIYYDDTLLQPDLTASSATAPFVVSGPVAVGGKKALHISFLPQENVASFDANEVLAILQFKALSATDGSELSMGAAYLYDGNLEAIQVQLPDVLHLQIGKPEGFVPVTSIALDKTEMILLEGTSETLKVSITPDNATDHTIVWSTSDSKVATVSGGLIKALTQGTATITATTKDGGFSASCIVRVIAPDAGYTVTMPSDTSAAIGETIKIPVAIGHVDGKTGYNAFDICMEYDPQMLELVSTHLSGVTVSASRGTVEVLCYGETKPAGSVPFILEFRALQTGDTKVCITSARVDNSENAVIQNASRATVLDGDTKIRVTGYPVGLPYGFIGADTAMPNKDYTFHRPDDSLDYTVSATVGGKDVPVQDNGDGSYTIRGEYVTGPMIITASKTGNHFKVTLGTNMSGSITAQFGMDYTATLNKEPGYTYQVRVTIGGKPYTGYGIYDGQYSIPGNDITGNIVFTVTKIKIELADEEYVNVNISGSGAGVAENNAQIAEKGETYTLVLTPEAGYTYHVSYQMGNGEWMTLTPDANGDYIIKNVTLDLHILVEKSLAIETSIHNYVTLDQKTMFLILAHLELNEGKVLTCNGEPMYYSEAYNAWAYLVITDRGVDAVREQLLFAISEGTCVTIEQHDYDVNGSGSVDINDAQLVYDIYNAKYDSFLHVNLIKFLQADINGDKKINVQDAANVVRAILTEKEELT